MTHAYADHGWFDYRDRVSAPVPDWGGGHDVAIHLIVAVQSFPLAFKTPFPVPGGLERPYPDITHWTQRQVGLREGLVRLLDLLDDAGLACTLSLDADACGQTQALHGRMRAARYSVAAAGRDASCLHAGFDDEAREAAMVRATLAALRDVHGFAVDGWHPPAGAHSPRTMAVLASAGVDTVVDLNNDDMPLRFRTERGTLLCVPAQHFASDAHCLLGCKQATADYLADLDQGVRWLLREADTWGPRLLTVPVHPWVMGAPHRFGAFARRVRAWAAMDRVRFVGLKDIKNAWRTLP